MLTKKEFKLLTSTKTTKHGMFLRTQTSICRYGQAFLTKENLTAKEAMAKYLKYYYPMYQLDAEHN